MSKIKKKIPHKIIWDRTEHMIAPRPGRGVVSPHLLDLRTHQSVMIRHHSSLFGWCLRRCDGGIAWALSYLQRGFVVYASVFSLFRFPSFRRPRAMTIDMPRRVHAEVSLHHRLLHRFPWLGSVMVGTLFLFIVGIMTWIARAPQSIWVIGRDGMSRVAHDIYRFYRLVKGTIRYWVRRLRLAIQLWIPEYEAQERSTRVSRIPVITGRQRMLVVFVFLLLVIVLPFQFISSAALPSIETLSIEGREMIAGMTDALTAMEDGRWVDAEQSWSALERQSIELGETTHLTNPLVGGIGSMVSDQIRTGRALLATFQAATALGRDFSVIGGTADAPLSVSERLARIRTPFMDAREHVRAIATSLDAVDAVVLPKHIADAVETIRQRLPYATALFDRVARILDPLPTIIGEDRPMRYLVLLQNDAELRPTGGFIGSIAVVDVRHGGITNTFVPKGGSYDLQGSLQVNVQSPLPLQHVNARWEFQDANWSPDFPTSAKKLLWFWDEADGPTVDGVIALNASFIERLLGIVGPIELPEYGITVTSDNFIDVTQRAVEFEYDRVANTPKQFIADVMESLLHRIDTNGTGVTAPMLLAFFDALERRDLMVYMRQPDMHALVARAGIDGAVPALEPFEDGLMVVHTNIGGEKTDRVVSDSIRHESRLDSETGAWIDTVTMTRTHRGIAGQKFTGGRNRDYVRFYIPQGSKVLEADGFMLPTRPRELPLEEYTHDPDLRALEQADSRDDRTSVYTDIGRTVVGGWIELDAGQVHTVQITYTLPWTVADMSDATYRLRVDRQSGYRRATIEHRTELPTTWHSVRHSPSNYSGPLPFDRDYLFSETVRRSQ